MRFLGTQGQEATNKSIFSEKTPSKTLIIFHFALAEVTRACVKVLILTKRDLIINSPSCWPTLGPYLFETWIDRSKGGSMHLFFYVSSRDYIFDERIGIWAVMANKLNHEINKLLKCLNKLVHFPLYPKIGFQNLLQMFKIDSTFKPSMHCAYTFIRVRAALFFIRLSFVTLIPDI